MKLVHFQRAPRGTTILLVLAHTLFGQIPNPQAMITEALKPFITLRTYRGEFMRTYANSSTKECVDYHRIVMADGPHKRYIDQSVPVHLITIMSDDTIWLYAPEKLQYHQRPFEKNLEPSEITSLQRIASLEIVGASLLPAETLSVNGKVYDCNVVEANFRLNSKSPQVTVTFFMDSDKCLRRVVESGAGNVITTTILSLEPDVQFPDSQFQFVPPSNATRVARFE